MAVLRITQTARPEQTGIKEPFRRVDTSKARGGIEGAAIAQLGGVVTDVSVAVDKMTDRINDEKDANAAFDAYMQADEEARRFLDTPETGVLQRKGRNAAGIYEESGKFFDDTEDNVSKDLANERQKRGFAELWAKKRSSTMDAVARKAAKEHNEYRAETLKTMKVVAINDAMDGYNDPVLVQEAMDRGILAIDVNRRGKSNDVVSAEKEELRSKIHLGVVKRMSIDDPEAAEEYYKNHKKDIKGGDELDIERSLGSRVQAQKAQDAADDIIAQGGDYEDWINETKKIDDAGQRAEVRRLIDNEQVGIDKAKRVRTENEGIAGWSKIHRLEAGAGNRGEMEKVANSISDHATKVSMKEYINKTAGGLDVVTDLDEYYGLRDMMLNDPEGFKKFNLLTKKHVLSPSDFKTFANIQKDPSKQKDETAQYRTVKQMADDALKAVKIDTTPKPGSKDSKRVNLFRQRLDEEIREFEDQDLNGKRKASKKEVQDIVNSLSREVLVKEGWFWDDTALGFEVEDIDITVVPDEHVDAINKAYRRKFDKDPTEEQIVDFYKQKQRGGS